MDRIGLRGAECDREGRSTRDDPEPRRGMGQIRDPFERDRSGAVPYQGRRVGDHQELANLAAYLVSDFSAYLNGEVITIDGGEWLKGAGQFNMLEQVPSELWDMLEAMLKARKLN